MLFKFIPISLAFIIQHIWGFKPYSRSEEQEVWCSFVFYTCLLKRYHVAHWQHTQNNQNLRTIVIEDWLNLVHYWLESFLKCPVSDFFFFFLASTDKQMLKTWEMLVLYILKAYRLKFLFMATRQMFRFIVGCILSLSFVKFSLWPTCESPELQAPPSNSL